jgi:Clp amino terminal domain, pathogenicity island component
VFERFSEGARQVVVVADQEARELGHDHLGTEHLLIAVLREEVSVPRALLAIISLTADEARAAVTAVVGRGDRPSPRQLPFTPRAARVVQRSVGEALSMGRVAVDPEHLLLALIEESEGTGARILREAGADARSIRAFATGEIEVDFGWRGRSIALASLGAAVLGRSAFGFRRTGGLAPIDMQLLAYLVLGERAVATAEPGEVIESLAVALACDLEDIRVAVESLRREGLIAAPTNVDTEDIVITPEGRARVEQWLRRTAPLFGGWPPTVPGVDDV